jgi:hypothetical protein
LRRKSANGSLIIELTDADRKESLAEARYILRFCEKMGFRLFACH